MRVDCVKVESFGPLRAAEIDLARLRAAGVVVVGVGGRNGAGKTHLVEAMLPAVLYRQSPMHQANSWTHLGPEGQIQTRLHWAGKDWSAVLRRHGRSAEAYLLDDGQHVAGPQLRDFDRAVAQHFPPLEVVLASLYSAQLNVEGIFAAQPAVRRAVLTRLVGVDRMDAYVKHFAAKERDARAQVEWLQRTLAQLEDVDEVKLGREVADLHALREDLLRQQEVLRPKLDAHRRAWDEAREAAARLAQELEAQRAVAREKQRLLAEVRAAQTEAGSLARDLRWAEETLELEQSAATAAEVAVEETLQEVRRLESELLAVKADRQARVVVSDDARQALGAALEEVDLEHPMCSVCPLVEAASNWVRPAPDERCERELELERLVDQAQRRWKADRHEVVVRQKAVEEAVKRVATMKERQASLAKLLAVDVRELERELAGLSDLSDKEHELERAREREREAEQRWDDCAKQLTAVQGRITDLNVQLAALEERLASARQQKMKLKTLQHQLRQAVESRDDYGLLAEAWRDIREKVVSDLCPAIAQVANELLGEAFGTKYRLVFDEYTPTILDTRKNAPVSLSGGERAFVAETFRSAVCVATAEMAGLTGGTLIRDESTSALDRDNAAAYLELLRLVVERGGFSQVVLVTHHEHVWSQTDALLWVENGTVSVVAN